MVFVDYIKREKQEWIPCASTCARGILQSEDSEVRKEKKQIKRENKFLKGEKS